MNRKFQLDGKWMVGRGDHRTFGWQGMSETIRTLEKQQIYSFLVKALNDTMNTYFC